MVCTTYIVLETLIWSVTEFSNSTPTDGLEVNFERYDVHYPFPGRGGGKI